MWKGRPPGAGQGAGHSRPGRPGEEQLWPRPGGWRKTMAPCSSGHPLQLLLRDGPPMVPVRSRQQVWRSPASGAARMQPQGRGGSSRAPPAQGFPGGFSGRDLIPSGKKFAWLALGQQLPPSRLPLAGTFQEDSPWAWPAACSHLDMVSRCSWSSDFCQGNRGAILARGIEILPLEHLGRFHWPLDHWAEWCGIIRQVCGVLVL